MGEDLKALAQEAIESSKAQQDPDYPLFHVAPPVGRLNDPNGLIIRDGTYHAFYQFSPFHGKRKLVYWGHSTSTDLTHWQHQEPAIIPDSWYDRNGAYSGNAISYNGTVYLNYTGNVRPSEDERDTHQCVVTSTDMLTFTKSPRNPLIPEPPQGYTRHVRDPQVWQDHDGTFRMCLGAQRENLTGAALLYRSQDLVSWEYEGELQFPDAPEVYREFGYMWECPSLVRVPDATGETVHDVLVFCPQGISPDDEGYENIFPACYVVGQLHGNELRNTGQFREIDRGFEFYAPQVFAREPGETGPTLMSAWVGNASEDDQPSMEHNWVHTLSVARQIVIHDGVLMQTPVLNLDQATDFIQHAPEGLPQQISAGTTAVAALDGVRSFAAKFTVTTPADAKPWTVRLGSSSRYVDLTFTATHMVVDRSTTRYPHGNRRHVTLPSSVAGAQSLTLEVLHDRSVTEIFVGDGAMTFTLRSYLDPENFSVNFHSSNDLVVTWLTAAGFNPA